jgi:hypothetical protein
MATPAEIRAVKEFKDGLLEDVDDYYLTAEMVESYYLLWLEAQMNTYREEPLISPEIITRVVAI